jgi:hypothetical protein
MMVPLKIVSLNTYLVSRHFNHNRVTYPDQRASRIRRFLEPYDLCFLQEVWGTAFPELTAPASPAAVNLNSENTIQDFQLPAHRAPFLGSWLMGTSLSELIYTAYLHFWQTGGLYDLSRGATCVYRKKHTFTKSRSKSLKGVEATLWRNIFAWGGRFDLLVFNTHLDPWSVENRILQTYEIEQFMKSVAMDMEDGHRRKTGVLVIGDFNVKAHNVEEYTSLFMSRGWNDLLAMVVIGNDRVNGCTDQKAHTYAEQNQLACCPEDYGRIDYIFSVDEINGKKFLPLKCVSSAILMQPPGEELSDHYPLVVEVIPDNDE